MYDALYLRCFVLQTLLPASSVMSHSCNDESHDHDHDHSHGGGAHSHDGRDTGL